MINPSKLILLLLSLGMYLSSGTLNSGSKVIDELDSNTNTLQTQQTSLFNPFGKNEYFLKAPFSTSTDTVTTWTYTTSLNPTDFYTLFVGFTVIDQDNANLNEVTLEVKCSNVATALVTLKKSLTDFLVQDVDIASINRGCAPELKRKDYLKTISFQNNSSCGTQTYIVLTINQVGTGTIFFYIKQLALFVNLCHPTCETCPATLSGLTCDTCAASFTLQGDNTCLCTSTDPPTKGVVTLDPSTNSNAFRYYCQTLGTTNSLYCTSWDSSSKLPFDYCKACGEYSKAAQYFAPLFTYSASGTNNNVNPAVTQTICDCQVGTTLRSFNSNYKCLTDSQYACPTGGYTATDTDTTNVYNYLANLGKNLGLALTKETDATLGDAYQMKFKIITEVISPAYLINFKAYYTYSGTQVLIILEEVLNQEYYLKIKVSNLSKIAECSYRTISASAKLWKCDINFVAYNPCNDVVYMTAYIPIQIGEGLVASGATDTITAHFETTELDIPCVQSNECFVNSAFTTSIYHCIDQTCATTRVLSYYNGDIVWLRPDVAPAAGDTHTYKKTLEYGSFYFYDATNSLVSTLDVINKASTGLSGDNKSVWGFPIEITGEIENSGVLATGHVALTVTFRLDILTARNILQISQKYSITTPVSLIINIDDNQTDTAFVSALIAAVTVVLCAAIIAVVVYCLLRKNKIEDKKPQEVKVIVETEAVNLSTGTDQKINAEEQKICVNSYFIF